MTEPPLPQPQSADGLSSLSARLAGLDRAALVALVRADHRARWRGGREVPVEAYLRRLPALAADPSAVLELVRNEWQLRDESGRRPDLADYQARFPALAPALAEEWELWREVAGSLLEDLPEDAAATGSFAGLPPTRDVAFPTPPLPDRVEPAAIRPPGERYAVLRLHAEGGLGQVFVARDQDLNREVALKQIRPERAAHSGSRRRFLKEAQVTGQLEHPNIVPVYELAHREGQPFYAMRLVRGQTLGEAIADYHRRRREGRDDPLDRPRLLTAFVAVCQAVAFAHSRGVLHRDLKPGNVVLGSFGEVLVLDWGLAKVMGQPDEGADEPRIEVSEYAQTGQTAPGVPVGTPAYIPPEQAEGEHAAADERTDVYGLGAILFDLLTGRPPHTGRTPMEAMYAAVARPTPRAVAVEPSVPPALDAVCTKAMARDPADRYQRAADLAADVQRFLADEPVSAWRETWAVRARRWVGRHRTLVSSASAALAVLVVGLAVATALLTAANERERAARDLAQRREREARAERDRAAAHYRLARQAVEQYLDRVTESPELKARGLERLRKRLLETAVQFQQELIRQEGDDPAVRAERGRALWRLAAITHEIGTPAEALELAHRGREIQETLVREQPYDPTHREDLARTFNQLGNIAGTAGDLAHAEEFYDRALKDRRALADAAPDRADLAAALAATHNNLANLFRETGRWDRAEEAYGEAVKLFDRLAKVDPTGEYRRGLAQCLNNLGALQTDTGRPDRAEATLRAALGHWQALIGTSPDVPEHHLGLAGCRVNLGLALKADERRRDAEAEFRGAAGALEKLAAEHPDVGGYRQGLAKALGDLAVVLAATDRAAAKAAHRKALEIRERLVRDFPGVLDYRRDLAVSHGNLGRFLSDNPADRAEALAQYRRSLELREAIARENPGVPQCRAELANSYDNLGASDVVGRDEAEEFCRKALRLREELVRDCPSVPDYRANEARTHNNLGALHTAAGRLPAAEAEFDRARAVWERLVAEYPAVVSYRDDLAAYHFNRGILAQAVKQLDRAEDEYGHAREIWDRLARERPTVPRFADQAARADTMLAPLYRESGRYDRAETAYRDAAARWEGLARSHPAIGHFAVNLGQTYYSLGSLQALKRLRPADALPWYDRALATLDPVLKRDGSDPAARKVVFMAHHGRAVALGLLGRHAESLPAWDAALAADDGTGREFVAAGRALSVGSLLDQAVKAARAGDHARATALAAALDHEKSLTGPDRLAAARTCALAVTAVRGDKALSEAERAAAAKRYADQARGWLTRAGEAGDFRDPAARKKLANDPDFAAVKDSEEFRRAAAGGDPHDEG